MKDQIKLKKGTTFTFEGEKIKIVSIHHPTTSAKITRNGGEVEKLPKSHVQMMIDALNGGNKTAAPIAKPKAKQQNIDLRTFHMRNGVLCQPQRIEGDILHYLYGDKPMTMTIQEYESLKEARHITFV